MTAVPPLVIFAHRAQLDFMDERSVPYTGFVGGRGGGKSSALALKLYKWSVMERGLYGMYSSTYPLLSDTIQRVFLEMARPHIREFNQSKNLIKMWGGSEILCRSLDDPENARGPSLRGAVWDEASLTKTTDAFNILIACLRYQGEQGWLAAGFTPKGPKHWTTLTFCNPERTDSKYFHARTQDNPFNPPGFTDTLRRQYTKAYAEQEIEGKVVDLGGRLARREWFRVVADIPPLKAVTRYWDLASTPPDGDNNPDWTAGAKVGRTADGRWIVLDMRHARLSPGGNEMLIQHTAAEDGRNVRIGMEEEGGASGKSLVDHYRRRILVGYNFRGHRPTGDKVVRAMPWLAAAEAGNVSLLAGRWNKDFLDEVESFGPDCDHDDQVDAVSGAVNLTSACFIRPHVSGPASGSQSQAARLELYRDILDQAKDEAERQELLRIINSGQCEPTEAGVAAREAVA